MTTKFRRRADRKGDSGGRMDRHVGQEGGKVGALPSPSLYWFHPLTSAREFCPHSSLKQGAGLPWPTPKASNSTGRRVLEWLHVSAYKSAHGNAKAPCTPIGFSNSVHPHFPWETVLQTVRQSFPCFLITDLCLLPSECS